MISGLRQDISVSYMTILLAKLTNNQVRHQAIHKRAVSLVIAVGHSYRPQGFVWIVRG